MRQDQFRQALKRKGIKLEVTKTNELTVAQVILVTSLVAQTEKHLSTMQETRVQSLGWEDSLEKVIATHSGILA